MVAVEKITSLQNPRVKNVVRLGSRRHREQLRQTVVEGTREGLLALRKGIVPLEIFICPDYLTTDDEEILAQALMDLDGGGQTALFEVPSKVYDKMAYREGSGGLLMVIPYRTPALSDLEGVDQPLIAVIDGAEKPGNVGAVLRTADAAGVDALLLTGTRQNGTDIHNPNVIRASMGAYFTVPIVTTTREAALNWFQERGIMTVATTPEATLEYTAVSYLGPTAIIMGSEAHGLSPDWLQSADILVRIPMAGAIDSLNLSVSTAVVLYEALRQRNS